MKELKEIIFENLEDLKSQLFELVNNMEIDDKSEKILKRMIGAATRFTTDDFNQIRNFLINKGVKIDCESLVDDYFGKYNLKYLLKKICEENISFSFDLTKSHQGNIYEKIKLILPDNIDEIDLDKLLMKLAGAKNPKDGNGTGIFEVLINLFLNGTIGKNDKGDVNREQYTIEVKGPTGRVIGQKVDAPVSNIKNMMVAYINSKMDILGDDLYKSIKSDINSLNSFKERNIEKLFNGKTGICEKLNEIGKDLPMIGNVDNFVFDLLLYGLIGQFDNNPEKLDVWKNREKLFKQTNLIKDNKVNGKYFRKLMGCVQLYFYKQFEKFNHIIIFSGNGPDNAIKHGNYVLITEPTLDNIEYLWEFIENNKITFDGGGSTGRDNVCQIFYDKNKK